MVGVIVDAVYTMYIYFGNFVERKSFRRRLDSNATDVFDETISRSEYQVPWGLGVIVPVNYDILRIGSVILPFHQYTIFANCIFVYIADIYN